METEKLLEKLNELKITQKSGDWTEDLPEDIWENYFKDQFKTVAHGLEVDTHRWYETSISVIEMKGKYIGIEFISNMFSESSEWEDCCVTIKFHEMEEFTTKGYRKTKKIAK